MYELLKKDGLAKRGRLHTVHGVIETPVFMNVGTAAAIKGAVSTTDLQEIKTQVELSNTYHLHVRPGDEVIKKLGGLHKFMVWDKPILTDSGGFQVFSLAGLRRIKEEGVYFNSHIDGRKIFMGPEESMQIQSNLASTIAMAVDECPSSIAEKDYIEKSVDRTTRWLIRCKKEMERLNSLPDTINQEQMLFGINQGGIYEDIRIRHAKEIADLHLDGYAIGGLAVGESHEDMYRILDAVVPHLPQNAPTYLMGVGTPANILEAVDRGYRILKIKVGKEGRADVERIAAIRSAVGPDILLRVDANQGWNARQSVSIISAMEDKGLDIELVEQPVKAHDIEGMKYITRRVQTPILADESVFSPADAVEIIRQRAADLINIKLMKTGGIHEALKICDVAEIYGVECMIGCMLESRLSVAAAAHLAAGRSVITRADLDGPSLCSVDPYEGGPVFDEAAISMTGDPGIGVGNLPCAQWS